MNLFNWDVIRISIVVSVIQGLIRRHGEFIFSKIIKLIKEE